MDRFSQNIDKVTPWYQMHLSTKYEVNPSIGLGGVRGHTYRQTHRQRTLAQYNIDVYMYVYLYVYLYGYL